TARRVGEDLDEDAGLLQLVGRNMVEVLGRELRALEQPRSQPGTIQAQCGTRPSGDKRTRCVNVPAVLGLRVGNTERVDLLRWQRRSGGMAARQALDARGAETGHVDANNAEVHAFPPDAQTGTMVGHPAAAVAIDARWMLGVDEGLATPDAALRRFPWQ